MKYGRAEEIKRKLRQLKRYEEKLRYKGDAKPAGGLVWERFFDIHDNTSGHAKYSPDKLTAMSKEEYKAVVDEYFAYVYYELYREGETEIAQGIYDPEILKKLGLPHDAGAQDIKHQFRELAKRYHPDTGGDAAKFIDLMEAYRQLIDNK
jgi:hypothetical protein